MTATIEVRCGCGEVYRADASQAGRRLRCRCGRTPLIRQPVRQRAAVAGASLREKLRAPRSPPKRRPATSGRRGDPASSSPRLLIALKWLARGYPLAAVVAWLVLWKLGERWWPATVFVFGPRWLLLLPLAVLVPSAALLRPRLLLPLLAGLLVVLGPVMGLRTGWRRWLPAPAPSERVRILSLNAEGESGVQQGVTSGLARVLLETSPDVIVVQECGSELKTVFANLPGWHHAVEEGLCLLSRFPVLATYRFAGGTTEFARRRGIGGSGRAVAYTLAPAGGPMRLVNLHLETPRKGLEGLFDSEIGPLATNTELRRIQSGQIARWVDSLGASLVVSGDFNMPVESPFYRQDWGGFRNAFSQAGTGFGWTRYNGWIRVRIDHVLARGAWKPVRAWVGPDVGSDHRPVIADLVRGADGG